MLLFKSQEDKSSSLPPSSPQTEIAFWEQLQFTFDMDNEPPRETHDVTRARGMRRTRSASVSMVQPTSANHSVMQSDARDAALLAQFAAAAGMSTHGLSHPSPYGSLMAPGGYSHSGSSTFQDQLFNHGDIGHTQLPPLSSLDFPWHHFPPQPHAQQTHSEQFTDMSRALSNTGTPSFSYASASSSLPPLMTNSSESSTTSRPRRASIANAVASSSTEPVDIEPPEGERGAIAEEKRRRNTAASARFRIKKKQRTVNLERSVSDLTGRAEDLEREAADLRRENGWLKEIVMLKGSRLAGVNLASHILAENTQRAAEAASHPNASASIVSGSKATNTSSDEASSDEEEHKASKKGKSRKK